MLSSAQLAEILQTIPAGFKQPNDEFFTKGNKELVPVYKKLGVISNPTAFEEEEGSPDATEIHCNVPGCQLMFDGVAAYQTHFNSVHRYLCAECRRSLPTAHLLDLHVSERHDSYFAVRVERGEPMYACFLEECKQKMLTPEARKEHCISVHKFPGNYRFDQLGAKREKQHKSKGEQELPIKSESATMEAMDVGDIAESVCKTKSISFGHPKEKTFQTKPTRTSKPRKKDEAQDETLDDMQELKDVLQELD